MNKKGDPSNSHSTALVRLTRRVRHLQSRFLSRSRRRGQGMVEFALILPLLLLVMLGTIEFGYIFTVYSGMFNAAREGTRYGVANPQDITGIIATAREKILMVDPSAVNINLTYDQGPGGATFIDPALVDIGDRVVISVTYDLPTITPVMQPIVSSMAIRTEAARTVVSLGAGGDTDEDGIPNQDDNCPYHYNPSQNDSDGDGLGDACDFGDGGGDEGGGGDAGGGDEDDTDFDGVLDPDDNCPFHFNPDQADADGDTIGDDCEMGILVSVLANPQTVTGGELVDFAYVVTNTGVVNLDVSIQDSFGRTFSTSVAAGAAHLETVVEEINMTTTDNVVAIGYDQFPTGRTVSDSDSIVVTVVGPAIDLTVAINPQPVAAGELVTLTYTVKNVGDADFATVAVWDSVGTSVSYNDLAVGQAIFWDVNYIVHETTPFNTTAEGTTAQNDTARDTESGTVVVVDLLDPIVISIPLVEGTTTVAGTAHAGRTVRIRDQMSDTFPSPSVVVQPDGTFEFSSLPPLVAGHVIAVQGYDKYDSALVGAVGGFQPIAFAGTLCHDATTVAGTAEPNQILTLVITDTDYQDRATVDGSGNFAFTLPADQPLQTGQIVQVTGYGESISAEVQGCGLTDAYLSISPQCGAPGSTVLVTVRGYNWPSSAGALKQIGIYWDTYDGNAEAVVDPAAPQFDTTFEVTVGEGTHTILARTEKSNGSPTGGVEAQATFVSPCPSPNLVISDLNLVTSTPISTYQPVDFSVTVANLGTRPVNSMFWVDLYAADPASQTTGITWAAVNGLDDGDSTVITITLQGGFTTTGTHQIWAFADSVHQVGELDEDDNAYGPISATVSLEGTPPPTLPVTTTAGSVAGETWVSLTGVPVPHGRANVYLYQEDTLVASTVSDDSASYEFVDVPVGTYTVIGETWINGIRYSNTYEIEVLEDEATVRFIIMYRD